MARRYLIVNADDFGRSSGVNRGVIEAYEGGIVTSASLLESTYRSERAEEVKVLCDARVRAAIVAAEIQLCSFDSEVSRMPDPTP